MTSRVSKTGRRWLLRLLMLALLLVTVVGLVWLLERVNARNATENLRAQAQQTLGIYQSNLEGEIARFQGMSPMLSRNPLYAELLRQPDDQNLIERVNLELAEVNRLAGSLQVFLLDRNGVVVATSNWDQGDTFVGENLSFRPYFSLAIKGRIARYSALGSSSRQRGYFISAPVHAPKVTGGAAGDTEIIGVITTKVDFELLEAAWVNGNERVVVTDADGVIFVSSDPDWLYSTIRKLTPEKQAEIQRSRRYGDLRPERLDVRYARFHANNSTTIAIADQQQISRYLMQSKAIINEGWVIHILSSLKPVGSATSQLRWIAALMTLLLALLIALWLSRREAQRKQLRVLGQLKDANDRLEERVYERTRQLTLSNEKLRREVIERHETEQELRDTQSNLVHAGKMAVLGQMATSITHELNQPLGAIRTLSDNATTFLDKQRYPEVRNNLNLVSHMADRMNDMMKHLKQFSRKTPLAIAPVSVKSVLDETVLVLHHRLAQAGVEIDYSGVSDNAIVMAESVRLQQVLTNLLQNAIDASHSMLAATANTSPLSGTSGHSLITVRTAEPGDSVLIHVEDSGPGLDDEQLKHLFEPFYSTHSDSDGLGLGLAITRDIVEAFGGTISAANSPDRGALFVVTLPAAVEPSAAAQISNHGNTTSVPNLTMPNEEML